MTNRREAAKQQEGERTEEARNLHTFASAHGEELRVYSSCGMVAVSMVTMTGYETMTFDPAEASRIARAFDESAKDADEEYQAARESSDSTSTEGRLDRIAAYIRAELLADAMRAVADPDDDFSADDVTDSGIIVE